MPNVPNIPGAAVESFTASAGTTNVFTTSKPAVSVNHITAVEAFEFDITRIGGVASPIDLIAKKPDVGNYPLRLWFVDFGLTAQDQLPTTFVVNWVDIDNVFHTQTFTRTGSPTALPMGTASVTSVTATLGVLPWTYTIGLEVHVYAMGVEPSHDLMTDSIPDGDIYHFSGSCNRRLALGDDYLVDDQGHIKVLTNLVEASSVIIDYDFAIRSALTGW